ncbi:MAG: BrnT family toxin [Polyangiaceae bacterium]
MSRLKFEWDERKNRSNQHKHGVSFEEAETVFLDENALLLDDPDHSDEELRFVLLGFSSALHLLVVCHCERGAGSVIRIISARKADRSERTQYTRGNRT